METSLDPQSQVWGMASLEGEGFMRRPLKGTFCVPACVALSGLFHGPHLFPGLAPWALLFRTFGA